MFLSLMKGGSEGWHGRLNAANHHNPIMWTFLEILKVEITLVRRELLDYRLGGEKRKRTYIKDMNKPLKNLCERPIRKQMKKKSTFSTPLHFYSSIVFCSPFLCTFSILLIQFRNSNVVVVVFSIIFNVSSM